LCAAFLQTSKFEEIPTPNFMEKKVNLPPRPQISDCSDTYDEEVPQKVDIKKSVLPQGT
jgi:hypothetical protein